jgi:EpsI family protein
MARLDRILVGGGGEGMSALLSPFNCAPGAALKLLPGLLVILCLVLLFRDTLAEMVDIYDRSETFAHAYLVPPISLWLIWRQRYAWPTRREVGALGAVADGRCLLLWLVGELASVNAATQVAVVSLLMLTVPLVYGWRWRARLMFPLLFLYFSVPIGLFLVPMMMDHTADFTVAGAAGSRRAGVPRGPAVRHSVGQLVGGRGLQRRALPHRFSFMVGTLFAYLNYTSWKRRLLFIGISIVVPIVANWLRAYMIVMLGHLSGNNELAVGVDHLIYGWVFFGIVIGIMFMVGAKWSQPNEPQGKSAQPAFAMPAVGLASGAARSLSVLWATSAAAVLLMLGVHGVLWSLDSPRTDPLKPLKLPVELSAPWQPGPDSITAWVPAFGGAKSTDQRIYMAPSPRGDAPPQTVALWAAHYREQGREGKLVSSNNSLSRVEETQWAQVSRATQPVQALGQELRFRQTLLRGPGTPGSPAAQRLLVWQIYWLGGDTYTASDVRAKVLLALNRLRGRGDDSAVLIFYTQAGVIGLGYVGLPLVVEFGKHMRTIGFRHRQG